MLGIQSHTTSMHVQYTDGQLTLLTQKYTRGPQIGTLNRGPLFHGHNKDTLARVAIAYLPIPATDGVLSASLIRRLAALSRMENLFIARYDSNIDNNILTGVSISGWIKRTENASL